MPDYYSRVTMTRSIDKNVEERYFCFQYKILSETGCNCRYRQESIAAWLNYIEDDRQSAIVIIIVTLRRKWWYKCMLHCCAFNYC